MLNLLLMACGLSEPKLEIENPGLSGIPVEQKVEHKGVTALGESPEPALVATAIPGGLAIEMQRVDSCILTNHEVSAIRSDAVLDLRLELTPPPTGEPPSACPPDGSTRVEIEVQTNGPVFEVRFLDDSGAVITSSPVSDL